MAHGYGISIVEFLISGKSTEGCACAALRVLMPSFAASPRGCKGGSLPTHKCAGHRFSRHLLFIIALKRRWFSQNTRKFFHFPLLPHVFRVQDCEIAACPPHPNSPEAKRSIAGAHRTQWRFGSWTPVSGCRGAFRIILQQAM